MSVGVVLGAKNKFVLFVTEGVKGATKRRPPARDPGQDRAQIINQGKEKGAECLILK